MLERYQAMRQSDSHDRYENDTHDQVVVHDLHNQLERDTEYAETWKTEQVTSTKAYLDGNPSRQDETRRSTDSAKV